MSTSIQPVVIGPAKLLKKVHLDLDDEARAPLRNGFRAAEEPLKNQGPEVPYTDAVPQGSCGRRRQLAAYALSSAVADVVFEGGVGCLLAAAKLRNGEDSS